MRYLSAMRHASIAASKQSLGDRAATIVFDAKGSLSAASQWNIDPAKRSVGTLLLDSGSGTPVDMIGANMFGSGKIAALIEMRDHVLVDAQAQVVVLRRHPEDEGGREAEQLGLGPGALLYPLAVDVVVADAALGRPAPGGADEARVGVRHPGALQRRGPVGSAACVLHHICVVSDCSLARSFRVAVILREFCYVSEKRRAARR